MYRLLPLLLALTLGSISAAAPVTFVKVYSDGVELLQWTGTQTTLIGTWQLVYTTGTPPTLHVQNDTFSGTRTGATVSLKFTHSLLGSTETQIWNGTLQGTTLTLNRPLSQGGLASIVFQKSSPDAYNAAVAQLRTAVQRQQDQAQAAAQTQAQQQTQIDAQTRAVRDINNHAADALQRTQDVLSTLRDDQRDLTQAARAFPKDLASLQHDQQTVLKDAAKATDCADVSSVQGYDIDIISGYDLDILTGYDTDVLNNALSSQTQHLQQLDQLVSDISSVNQDFSRLWGKLSLSTVAFSVTQAQFDQARTALSTARKTALQTSDTATTARTQALQQAHTLITQAQNVADALTCQP
ncbi:hypothetical protein [Deinococcus ruber]|uniref:Uncharacterized protein n=1 Tax=Deinococcus ruber TaxID=1848197 RepID=A0A918F964_9DEIO|nr:hypothetical protein [Deinococcus ruber]GGR17472.1 hypothetical protein GCM10008957_32740 [Deinococcus ruber]